MKRAVFLDRDGTLVREAHYLSRLEDLEVLPGVAAALCRLAEWGYLRLLVTNQSGIARGYFERPFVDACHRELRRRLQAAGADLEACYVCPHHPEHTGPCACRKPAVGMVTAAATAWQVDLERSWVVGDKAADILLGRNAGCRTGLVLTGYGEQTRDELRAAGIVPDVVAADLAGVVEEIGKQ